MERTPFKIVIPARYGSSRLPGKPLLMLAGSPMILHVLARAREAEATEIVVATDDPRIVDVVTSAGATALMTSPDAASGTDRLAEVSRKLGWAADDVIVNLQGDEPLMPPELVRTVARVLWQSPNADLSTLAVRVVDPADIFNPNAVKVVIAGDGRALYFSRAPIPWVRGTFAHGAAVTALPSPPIYRHLGLYAYRAATLCTLSALAPSALEQAESLEQLRALEHGLRIQVHVHTGAPPPPGVDTPEDVPAVEQALQSAAAR